MVLVVVLANAFYSLHCDAQDFEIHSIPGDFGTRFNCIASNSGEIFIGSDKGIIRYENGVWDLIDSSDGLSSSEVVAISAHESGVVFSTDKKGLYRLYNGKIAPLHQPLSLNYNAITAILIRPQVDTLYGTDNGKLIYRTNGGSFSQWKEITPNGSTARINNIHSERIGSNPDFLVSATGNGNILWVPQANQITTFNQSNSPIPSNIVLSSANWGDLSYYGTDKGLYITDLTGFPGQQIKTKVMNETNSGLPSDQITSIELVGQDSYWLGTDKGLVRGASGNLTIYDSQKSNLPSNEVLGLTKQNDSTLWVLTADGSLSKLELATLNVDDKALQIDPVGLMLYPNPAAGSVTLEFEDVLDNIRVLVRDLEGKRISIQEYEQADQVVLEINAKPGLYFLTIEASGYKPTMRKLSVIKH